MMRKCKVTITRTTLKGASDKGFMPGSMAERVDFAWQLSTQVWSLVPNAHAKRRLQRHVAVLTRREG